MQSSLLVYLINPTYIYTYMYIYSVKIWTIAIRKTYNNWLLVKSYTFYARQTRFSTSLLSVFQSSQGALKYTE